MLSRKVSKQLCGLLNNKDFNLEGAIYKCGKPRDNFILYLFCNPQARPFYSQYCKYGPCQQCYKKMAGLVPAPLSCHYSDNKEMQMCPSSYCLKHWRIKNDQSTSDKILAQPYLRRI